MTGPPESEVACRRALDTALANSGVISATELDVLSATPTVVLDRTLRRFASDHGPAALPVLMALSSSRADRAVRRAAKRALYGLSQRGVSLPARPAPSPIVARGTPRAVRAWTSGIDGSGSRALWLLFEDAYGGLELCSLIVSDTVGIVEVAGGAISKKRLTRELDTLRATQKLPWVEMDPARVAGLVAEARELHTAAHTSPPPEFERWRPRFDSARAPLPAPPRQADPAQVERSAQLLESPEMAGWFLDPEAVQTDALDLLQVRESRLVVSDQIKAEREDAIVIRVVEREFSEEARRRWARRLVEMAVIFAATERPELARLAESAATTLADSAREPRHHPFARAVARRALEIAAEVALGRISAADVSRKPHPTRGT